MLMVMLCMVERPNPAATSYDYLSRITLLLYTERIDVTRCGWLAYPWPCISFDTQHTIASVTLTCERCATKSTFFEVAMFDREAKKRIEELS